jgi:hypothetical protein
MALLKAKDKNMPAVIQALEKKAEKRATERRTVIPSDRNSANRAPVNVNEGVNIELNEATLKDMRKLGITKEDLKRSKDGLDLR